MPDILPDGTPIIENPPPKPEAPAGYPYLKRTDCDLFYVWTPQFAATNTMIPATQAEYAEWVEREAKRLSARGVVLGARPAPATTGKTAAPDPSKPAAQPPAPAERDALQAEAARIGLTVDPKWNSVTLRKRIAKTQAEQLSATPKG